MRPRLAWGCDCVAISSQGCCSSAVASGRFVALLDKAREIKVTAFGERRRGKCMFSSNMILNAVSLSPSTSNGGRPTRSS
eukprot:scaffold114217_cov37-Prasinocladus_malaysianus.AAC.1